MRNAQTDRLRISLSAVGIDGDIHVVRVDGRIDTLTTGELDEIIGSLVGRGCLRLIVDLAGVNYISSAGWGVFVSRLREVREGGGDIKLARMNNAVRQVYDLLEFEGLLPSHNRLDEAQARFDGRSLLSSEVDPVTAARSPTFGSVDVADDKSPSAPATLDAAVLQLLLEDPFYSIGELRVRLTEIGDFREGWWAIWRVLRRRRMLRQKQRFRYFRRHRRSLSSA